MTTSSNSKNTAFHQTVFGRAVLGLLLVWILLPFARRATTGPVPSEADARSGDSVRTQPEFHQRPEIRREGTQEAQRVVHQIDRHSRHLASGFYERVENHPGLPDEIKQRFLRERDRLTEIAGNHQDMSARMNTLHAQPPAFTLDAEQTPQQSRAWAQMERNGLLDQLNADYVQSLLTEAGATDVAEDERPDPEFIRQVMEKRLIPVL
jgi:hypothetical protein